MCAISASSYQIISTIKGLCKQKTDVKFLSKTANSTLTQLVAYKFCGGELFLGL